MNTSQAIAGDKDIHDLTPKTLNYGGRIVKNMRICGSGIYTYDISEADVLHLTPVPDKYKDLQYINVYRPPEVLQASKDDFARVPIITGHHIFINTENAKDHVCGMVGDTVDTEVGDDGELYLYTTGTIVTEEGIKAYEEYGQLSVGYDPVIEWEEGEHNGTPYQAVLRKFNDINHLLICKVARGGPQCMVMDSLDGKTPLELFNMKHIIDGGSMFKRVFGKKKIAGDSLVVETLLQSVAIGADAATQVNKVREIVGDSDPAFNEYLSALSKSKGEKQDAIKEAVGTTIAYYKEHFCGDEGKSTGTNPEQDDIKPDTGDERDKDMPEDEKDKDKDKAEDEDKSGDVSKDKAEVKDEKECGGDSIDYGKLAEAIVRAKAKMAGDENPIDEKLSQESLAKLSMAIAGDSSKTDSISSDAFMAMLRG